MPSDTDVWGSLLAGPYAGVVVIVTLLWLGAKEYRKGRKERVEEAEAEAARQKVRAERAEAERDTGESKSAAAIAQLREEILKLQEQVFQLQRKLAAFPPQDDEPTQEPTR